MRKRILGVMLVVFMLAGVSGCEAGEWIQGKVCPECECSIGDCLDLLD